MRLGLEFQQVAASLIDAPYSLCPALSAWSMSY